MKTTITYTTNTQLWKMEGIAEAHGFTKIADCYWAQIFINTAGNEIMTVREDAFTADPVELMRHAARPTIEEIVEPVMEQMD